MRGRYDIAGRFLLLWRWLGRLRRLVFHLGLRGLRCLAGRDFAAVEPCDLLHRAIREKHARDVETAADDASVQEQHDEERPPETVSFFTLGR